MLFEEDKEKGRLPLHNLEGIVSFGYRGVSPALMGSCAEKNISLCFMTPQGKFLARITGKTRGNVLLREQQYASSLDSAISLEIAKNCILPWSVWGWILMWDIFIPKDQVEYHWLWI